MQQIYAVGDVAKKPRKARLKQTHSVICANQGADDQRCYNHFQKIGRWAPILERQKLHARESPQSDADQRPRGHIPEQACGHSGYREPSSYDKVNQIERYVVIGIRDRET
jgi:hypothetical protein